MRRVAGCAEPAVLAGAANSPTKGAGKDAFYSVQQHRQRVSVVPGAACCWHSTQVCVQLDPLFWLKTPAVIDCEMLHALAHFRPRAWQSAPQLVVVVTEENSTVL